MGTSNVRNLILVAALLCAAMSLAAGGGSERCATEALSPRAAQAAKHDIVEVIDRMQDAWNRGDFRGYMQGFKNPDVVFVSGGRVQDGWQGTLDHYIRDYGASLDTRGTLRFYDIEVEVLAPDAAQLVSHFELRRPMHPQYGINTRLMRKVDGHWVIALNHVSASENPPAQATAH